MSKTVIQHHEKDDIENIQSMSENDTHRDGRICSTNREDLLEYYRLCNYTNTSIEMNMKKSYWDNVYTDILKCDFSALLNILLEMKQMIKDLIPNRKDIHEELDESLDLTFIHPK